MKLLIVASLALVASVVLGHRDMAKVDEALRHIKGDNNEIYHGPDHKEKPLKDFSVYPTKKEEKRQRDQQHQLKRKEWPVQHHSNSQGFDDPRLQSLAYQPNVDDVDDAVKAPTGRDGVKRRLKKAKKNAKKLEKKSAFKKKAARKQALKEEMRLALDKGMSPDKVLEAFQQKKGKFSKRFYAKFVQKYQDKTKKKARKALKKAKKMKKVAAERP